MAGSNTGSGGKRGNGQRRGSGQRRDSNNGWGQPNGGTKNGQHRQYKQYGAARGPHFQDAKMHGDPGSINKAKPVERPRKELDRNFYKKGGIEQKKMLEDLSKEIARYDSKAIDYLSESVDWINNQGQGETQVDMMNKMYSRYLIIECAKPIMQGRDADAVLQAMGIMVAGYLTNPEFKKTVNETAQKAVYPYVKHKAEVAGPDSKWRDWCDKIEATKNGGHLPLCGKSAAAMKIAIDRKFYNAMREDGADMEKLTEQYNKTRDQLYVVAKNDGVSREDLDNNVRTLFGQMQGVDPTISRMYSETAFEDVVKSGTHEVKRKDEHGKEQTQHVWDGQFEYRKGGKDYDKGFTVRRPTNRFSWINRLNGSMEDAFGRCKTAEDVFQLGRVINGEKIDDVYPKGSAENKRYSWMTEWQRKNERDFDIMYDDCRNVDDYEALDSYVQDVTSAHFENWLRSHPKEAQKAAQSFYKSYGKEYGTKDGNVAVYDPAGYKEPGKPYIPPERRIEMPEELRGDDNELPAPVYGG